MSHHSPAVPGAPEGGRGDPTPPAPFRIPAHFGDPAGEYRALVGAAGFADRSHRGRFDITGSDRVSFLQGLVTADLRPLRAGHTAYAVLADRNGGIVSDLWIHDRGDHLRVETEPGMDAVVRPLLEQHVFLEEVSIAPPAGRIAVIGVEGPLAADLAGLVLTGFAEPGEPLSTRTAGFAAGEVLVTTREARPPQLFALDLEIAAARAGALWRALEEAGATMGARAAGHLAEESRRIERGIPRGGIDLDEDVIVLEARLDHVVSYDKGCYLGQETIAKMHYRGKPRQLLTSFVFEAGASPEAIARAPLLAGEEAPARGTPVFAAGRRVGRITCTAWGFGLDRWIGLGYLRRDLDTPEQRLTVGAPDGPAAEAVEPGTLHASD